MEVYIYDTYVTVTFKYMESSVRISTYLLSYISFSLLEIPITQRIMVYLESYFYMEPWGITSPNVHTSVAQQPGPPPDCKPSLAN